MWGDDIKKLEGLVVEYIDIVSDDGDELMITTKCGKRFKFHHYQDCCENVRIWSTKGDLKKLEGHKLVSVDMDAYTEDPDDEDPKELADTWRDSWTWTDIVFKTTDDTVISRWFGESNGYYSESVDFSEL